MPRITITASERTPQPYQLPLDSQMITLGRAEENDIVIDCASVSGKHAQMVRVEGGFELRDLASTNGTKLDGERRMAIPLRKGIEVYLGDVLFEYDLKPEEEAELANEAFSVEDDAEEPATAESVASGRSGAMMTILFLVLAALAFAVGMELSHRKNTGRSLWGSLGAPAAPAGTPASVAPPSVEGSN